MNEGLEALERIKKAHYFVDFELDAKVSEDYKEELDIIEKALKALEIIKENLKFGYVFIGFNEKEEPTFYSAPRDMYEEIKKNKNN